MCLNSTSCFQLSVEKFDRSPFFWLFFLLFSQALCISDAASGSVPSHENQRDKKDSFVCPDISWFALSYDSSICVITTIKLYHNSFQQLTIFRFALGWLNDIVLSHSIKLAVHEYPSRGRPAAADIPDPAFPGVSPVHAPKLSIARH